MEVHETFEGRVLLRVEGLDLRTVLFNPEGGVRQQDIDNNKSLATTLAKIRQDQLARDEERLTRIKTLREKRKLDASLDARRKGRNPTSQLWFDIPLPRPSSGTPGRAHWRARWPHQKGQLEEGSEARTIVQNSSQRARRVASSA